MRRSKTDNRLFKDISEESPKGKKWKQTESKWSDEFELAARNMKLTEDGKLKEKLK